MRRLMPDRPDTNNATDIIDIVKCSILTNAQFPKWRLVCEARRHGTQQLPIARRLIRLMRKLLANTLNYQTMLVDTQFIQLRSSQRQQLDLKSSLTQPIPPSSLPAASAPQPRTPWAARGRLPCRSR